MTEHLTELPRKVRYAASLAMTAAFVTIFAAQAGAQVTAPAPAPAATSSAGPETTTTNQSTPESPTGTRPTSLPTSAAPSPATGRVTQFRHLPVVDIIPTYTQDLVSFKDPAGTHYAYPDPQPADIAGTVTEAITRGFSASFDRLVEGTLNAAAEQVTNARGQVIATGPPARDVILVYRADAQLLPFFFVESGFSFRHRECCPASSMNSPNVAFAGTEQHYGYFGMTYTTPSLPRNIKYLGSSTFVLNITGLTANHDPSPAGTHPGDIGHRREYGTQQSVAFIVPFDRKDGLTASVKDAWGALNMYENWPFPTYWSGVVTSTLSKSFGPLFSLSIVQKNQHQRIQGYPYVAPNVLHFNDISVIADFHLDFNGITSR